MNTKPELSKPKRDETPTEVYMRRGFFPPDGSEKLPAGTFQKVPAWQIVKLMSRGIIQDAKLAHEEIEAGEPEAVLRRERGKFALARKESMRDAPENDNWLEDE